jgi:hypothetical protein
VLGTAPPRANRLRKVALFLGLAAAAGAVLTVVLVGGGAPGTGRLTIDGVLPVGGELRLSGPSGDREMTPGTVELPEGDYVVRAAASGFAPFEMAFTITGGEEARIPLRMSPLAPEPEEPRTTATVVMNWTGLPRGATVVLVGADSTIPIRSRDAVEVPGGSYTLQLSADGFETARLPVRLEAGMNTLAAPRLTPTAPRSGRLVLTGDAPGSVRISIRGESDSWTLSPGGRLDLPPGSYTLEATAGGYEPFRRSFTIEADAEARIVLAMQPLAPDPPPAAATGRIIITGSVPESGTLRLEGPGGSREVSPGAASVPPGSYSLVASAPHRETRSVGVTVEAGGGATIAVPSLPIAAAVLDAAQRIVEDIVGRFHRRDAGVADLMTGAERDSYRAILSNTRSITELSAALVSRDAAVLEGSGLDARFRMRLSFVSGNIETDEQLVMVVRAEDRNGQWIARSLEVVR